MNSFENWFCASGLWRYVTERKWLPWLLEEMDVGEHVLEVGAGPGAATAELARRARSVTSLEYSHDFCVKLHAKSDAACIVQGDASVLPFESQTFTSAIAVLVLHHLRSSVEHFSSTFVPVSIDGLNSRLRAAGFSNVSVNNHRGAIRIRAQRSAGTSAREQVAR